MVSGPKCFPKGVSGPRSFPWSWLGEAGIPVLVLAGGRGRDVLQSGPKTGVPLPTSWDQDKGTPQPIPLARTRTGITPHQQDMAWTGYSVGGMPSVFSRSTFLLNSQISLFEGVEVLFNLLWIYIMTV